MNIHYHPNGPNVRHVGVIKKIIDNLSISFNKMLQLPRAPERDDDKAKHSSRDSSDTGNEKLYVRWDFTH